MHMIAFECSFAKEWNELQKTWTCSSGPLCQEIQRDRSDRLRQDTEPALLMSKSELVIPSTPSFLVLNPKGGIFESFLLSFGKFPALNQWAKSWRVHSYYTPILQDGHLKMCLNSRVFTTALWLLWHSLWCQSPTPVLRSCLFKSCYVVSSAPEFYSKVQVDLQLQKPPK